MYDKKLLKASSVILKKAKTFGASLSGFTDIEDLKDAPSFTIAPKTPDAGEGMDAWENGLGLGPGEVAWPENAKTMLVIAVEHPGDKPEMDWWFGSSDPPGNRVLASVIKKLCTWISATYDIGTFHLPYHVEKGGTYLKDAAVLAGLGCVGKNNILVTPEFGPRVRLRALTLDVSLPSTGPSAFDPCTGCDAPCRRACPRKTFKDELYISPVYGQEIVPGRDGTYSRSSCNVQMDKDIANARKKDVAGFDDPVKVIKYCRNCELSCPVGRN